MAGQTPSSSRPEFSSLKTTSYNRIGTNKLEFVTFESNNPVRSGAASLLEIGRSRFPYPIGQKMKRSSKRQTVAELEHDPWCGSSFLNPLLKRKT